MKCARLNLQERAKGPKVKLKAEPTTVVQKPRRYCQKRMVDPGHEEDPRWKDLWDRFQYNTSREQSDLTLGSAHTVQDTEDIVLTVQTLKFQGDIDQTKRPRTSFKYKSVTDGNKHRMFVKEVVSDNEFSDEDRSSSLTSYYFDDYVKYLSNVDRSRPASSKSSTLKSGNNSVTENKSIQVEIDKEDENTNILDTNIPDTEAKVTTTDENCNHDIKEKVKNIYENMENTKIAYETRGKRKSLTISRNESPETVQVIRVDVVCNYSTSSILSNYEDSKDLDCSSRPVSRLTGFGNKHFANKYLLTNSVKKLDENLSGGSKVTLLCKTFKLTDRSPKLSTKPFVRSNKNTKSNSKIKHRKKALKKHPG